MYYMIMYLPEKGISSLGILSLGTQQCASRSLSDHYVLALHASGPEVGRKWAGSVQYNSTIFTYTLSYTYLLCPNTPLSVGVPTPVLTPNLLCQQSRLISKKRANVRTQALAEVGRTRATPRWRLRIGNLHSG